MTGDPAEDNRTRARRGLRTLEAFASQSGQAAQLDGTLNIPDDVLLEVGGDLIADLFHLARINGVDPAHLTAQGRTHYETEVGDERAATGVEEWEEGPDAFHYTAP